MILKIKNFIVLFFLFSPGYCQYQDAIFQWVKTFDISGSIGFVDNDSIGNLYTAGRFSYTADFDPDSNGTAYLNWGDNSFFAKYDSSGHFIWVKGLHCNSISGMSVDQFGNVYLTGNFLDSSDFDPGPNSAILVSTGITDVFFAKYDTDGNFLWAKKFGGPETEESTDMYIYGNYIYLTGTFNNWAVDFDPGIGYAFLNAEGSDIFFAKYDINGEYIWAKKIGNYFVDYSHSITVDSSQNVFISGQYSSDSLDFDPGIDTVYVSSCKGLFDVFVAKYDSSGNYLWAKTIGGKYSEGLFGFELDNNGNVFLMGSILDTVDFFTGADTTLLFSQQACMYFAKYDSNGNFLWVHLIENTLGNWYSRNNLVVTESYLFLIGNFGPTADFDPDSIGEGNLTSTGGKNMFMAKYDLNGNYVWAKGFGNGYPENGCKALLVNREEEIFLAGGFEGSIDFDPGTSIANYTAIYHDGFLVKYNSTDCSDFAPILSVISPSTICQGGSVGLSVNSLGEYLWNNGDTTQSINIFSSGNYFVSVTNTVGCTGYDSLYVFVIINNNPNPIITANGMILTSNYNTGNQWKFNYNIIPGATSQNYTVALNGIYTVVVTDSNGCNASSDAYFFTTIGTDEYSQSPIVSIGPNPSNGFFRFHISGLRSPISAIKVYNILGEQINTGSNTRAIETGTIDISGQPQGIYILHIQTENSIFVRQLIMK